MAAAAQRRIGKKLPISDLGIRDNSLDAYSAAANAPLLLESPADAISGGGERAFLGASRAYRFKKHLFENVDECCYNDQLLEHGSYSAQQITIKPDAQEHWHSLVSL